MPIWAFNNAADPNVDIEYIRDLIGTMREAGGNPRYTEFANLDHGVEEAVFKDTNVSGWLFAQKRTPIR